MSERASVCVYTPCSIMSLACVHKCVSPGLHGRMCVCVCVYDTKGVFTYLAVGEGQSLSYLIFISDTGND